MIDDTAIGLRFKALDPLLDERGRRRFAAAEAMSAGRGGVKAVSRITGVARSTITRGLAELRDDNKTLAARFREAHDMCNEHRDIARASLIEVWIDESERRTWFLFEASRHGGATAH